MHAPGSGGPGRPMGGPAMSRRQAREEAAHRFADAGWHVFPAEPGGKAASDRARLPRRDDVAQADRGLVAV